MKLKNSYIAVLIFFAGIFVSQNALKIYAQNSELIDSRTGKPDERKNLSRFQIISRASGIIVQTNIMVYLGLVETNDEQETSITATPNQTLKNISKHICLNREKSLKEKK